MWQETKTQFHFLKFISQLDKNVIYWTDNKADFTLYSSEVKGTLKPDQIGPLFKQMVIYSTLQLNYKQP